MTTVPPAKPTVIEGEFEMKNRQVIVFTGWTLPAMRDANMLVKEKPLTQYAGPGLAVEWAEIEGPIDPWPPPGYQRLFAGVPLKATSIAKAEAAGQPPPKHPEPRPDGWWIYDPLVPAPAKPKEDAERLMRAFLPLAFR